MLKIQKSNVKQLKSLSIILAISSLITFVIFYALVGAIMLHAVKRTPTYTGTCDAITREDGVLWCKAVMLTEDEDISIVRNIEEEK